MVVTRVTTPVPPVPIDSTSYHVIEPSIVLLPTGAHEGTVLPDLPEFITVSRFIFESMISAPPKVDTVCGAVKPGAGRNHLVLGAQLILVPTFTHTTGPLVSL